jgi:DNA repair exonuclease SbcCD ATPase subunit
VPNASYSLQSYKENKSGDIKAKFSDKLTIQGVERSIGSLSGGELRCLSLAVDFAVIDVVESTFGISINPIILDEPFEGLDSLNRERVIEILETLSAERQIWIVDHASEAKSMFSTVVKVEKKDGVSLIV